jgi:hypothetical protein
MGLLEPNARRRRDDEIENVSSGASMTTNLISAEIGNLTGFSWGEGIFIWLRGFSATDSDDELQKTEN